MKLTALDNAFSEYIRLRDANPIDGSISCISCGEMVYWKCSDCGHYVRRRHMGTRYHLKDNNEQCRICNRMEDGNEEGQRIGLVKKYGEGVLEELETLKRTETKYSQREINELTKFYINEIVKLKKSVP